MNNSCIVIYSRFSGNGKAIRKINYIKKKLSLRFSLVDLYETYTIEDLKIKIKKSLEYDSLIVCGGDGTFHLTINELMHYKKKPILGYINAGTLGDSGRNLGVRKSIKSAIEIISKGNTTLLDLGCINNVYFGYMASCGAFSRIASQKHRKLGIFSYYFHSFIELFKKQQFSFIINNKIRICVPFIMLLNGQFIGGFKINKKAKLNDGLIELLYSESCFLNSIPSFFISSHKIKQIGLSNCSIEYLEKTPSIWCLDGELYTFDSVQFHVQKEAIRVYSKL